MEEFESGAQMDPVRPGASGTAPGSQRIVVLRGTLSSQKMMEMLFDSLRFPKS